MKNKEKRKYIFIFLVIVGITVFIGYTLSKFDRDIQERVYYKQVENMREISMQGSAVVEKQLGGLVNTLYGFAEYLREEDICDDTNIYRLKNFLNKRKIGFQRMGIADADGNAHLTNGEHLNISDRTYFQTCMKEKRAATEIRQSSLNNQQICIVAVPILTESEEFIGVIYGVTELSMFRIYEDTIMEGKNQYIQIIDMEGNYIRKQVSSLIGKKDNIFEGISGIEGEQAAEIIRKKIQAGEQVYTEVSDGTSHEILYFTPLKLTDWCIVTVLDYSAVSDLAEYILGNDVYEVMVKVVLVIALLFLLIIYYSWQDRKRIQKFNEKLMFDEKVVQIAAEKSGFAIISYEIKSKQMRFIANTMLNREFPREINNAPQELMKYLPDDEKVREQIRGIFASLEQNGAKKEFLITLMQDDKKVYLWLQIITLEGKNGEIRKCVGVLEDVTEEEELREKADKDPLTGLYNRSSAIEKIEDCLKNEEIYPGSVHAYMIMDIDNFKTLNDTLGHQVGDKALQDVAGILTYHFRQYDIVCRLGGDEFLVFLKNIPEEVLDRNMDSLLRKLVLTYEAGGKSVQITVSAGIVVVPDSSMDFCEMYRRADEALYRVKHEKKNSFKIYGR